MRKLTLVIAILAFAVGLAACGGGGGGEQPAATGGQPAAAPVGDAAKGQELFAQQIINGNAGCVTCHSLEVGKVLVGPSLAGIASRAGSTVAGQSAEEYIRTSIVNPNAHLAKGCNASDLEAQCVAGLMPQDWQQKLTPEQLNDLVAYLLTLK